MLLTMTDKELHRIRMIEDVIDRRLSGTQAARRLGITARHLYRLVSRYEKDPINRSHAFTRNRRASFYRFHCSSRFFWSTQSLISCSSSELVTCRMMYIDQNFESTITARLSSIPKAENLPCMNWIASKS